MRVFLLAAALPVIAACASPQQIARVCMNTDLNGPAWSELALAVAHMSRTFGAASVVLHWTCRDDPSSIKLNVLREGNPGERPGVLAYAFPYGDSVVVFHDRITRAAGRTTVTSLLAYVLTHETTHVMQRISRHSPSGIMREAWDDSDYAQITARTLAFTPIDIQFIHQGLKARADSM